jgi:hypothetical protein
MESFIVSLSVVSVIVAVYQFRAYFASLRN